MINIGKKRECFFDNFLIDEVRTTAKARIHRPVAREKCFEFDAEWEGLSSDFHNFFYDKEYGKYRMYYLGYGKKPGIRACYAESIDGIKWERPNLGIFEFEGSTNNNILTDKEEIPRLDNFFVFKDENPDCPKEQKYKALLRKVLRGDPKEVHCDFGLQCMVSEDGIHFKNLGPIHEHAAYDTLNVAFWDREAEMYRCYFRWNHVPGDMSTNEKMGLGIRDIRYMESKDFVTWSEINHLDFGDAEDIPLYTNVVQPYYRAPHILIVFPTRYIERKQWTKCFDELCGRESRLERMKGEPRFGLAITDCVFMCSRDGVKFKRYDRAFMTPEVERPEGWVYGDCYPFYGMLETPSIFKDAEPEISFFASGTHCGGRSEGAEIFRYTLRLDGFVSRYSDDTEKMLVTKPFVYDGKDMYANMETSARGYMYFTLKTKDGEVIESCEMFGNSTDKKIGFDDGAVEKLCGKEVVLEVRMLDADIYAIRFE